MYKLSDETKKHINEEVKHKIGISYDEFKLLDFDEQQKYITKNKKNSNKNKTIMIGSGEQSIFTNKKHGERYMLDDGTIVKTGISSEEEKKKIENKLDDILYCKPITIVKKLTKKIQNKK